MTRTAPTTFDLVSLLAGVHRRTIRFAAKERLFSQGDTSDSVFYLVKGRVKVAVVSPAGKQAALAILGSCAFVGEEALEVKPGPRLATATAITDCTVLKISRDEMIRLMHEKHQFSDIFMKYLLARSMRIQADLVDQLFNSSEKRLARVLLLMAEFGQHGDPEALLPRISQETLAEMVGTTRSRVSHFMSRFRQLGFIEYKRRIRVHKSLMNVIVFDPVSANEAAQILRQELVSSPH